MINPKSRPGTPGAAVVFSSRAHSDSNDLAKAPARTVDDMFDWLPEDDETSIPASEPALNAGPSSPQSGSPTGEKLQKVLARSGLASRRVCEEMIEEGRVTVNGHVAVLGARVDAESDVVEVDGAPVGVAPGLVYYLLNKPVGVVSTAHDPQHRPTVVEMVPQDHRVFPVGRLDTDTEGLSRCSRARRDHERPDHDRSRRSRRYGTVRGVL